MSEPRVMTRGLGRVYAPGTAWEVVALRDVHLELAPAKLVALRGPSGSGKTTLLSLLGLLDAPTEGQVWLFGKSVENLSEGARTELRRLRLGFVFQDFALIESWSAWQNVACSLIPLGVPRTEQRRRALAQLESLGLGGRSDSLPHRLSAGERQRVAIARAVLHGPELLLADEPTSNLDEESGGAIIERFGVMAAGGTTVLAATHDARFLERADVVLELLGGGVRCVRG